MTSYENEKLVEAAIRTVGGKYYAVTCASFRWGTFIAPKCATLDAAIATASRMKSSGNCIGVQVVKVTTVGPAQWAEERVALPKK